MIRSTIHRVRAPASARTADGMIPERYSIPYVRNFSLLSFLLLLTHFRLVLW